MKTLVLHGELKELFGERFKMDVETPADAMRLMEANFPGQFATAMWGKSYAMYLDDVQVGSDHIFMCCGEKDIHLVPVLEGSISFKSILAFGLTLLVFAVSGPLGAAIFGAGITASLFAGALIIGTSALISTLVRPKAQNDRDAVNRSSFIFDGAVNIIEQGGPVPLVYGRARVGSVVVDAGISVSDVVV